MKSPPTCPIDPQFNLNSILTHTAHITTATVTTMQLTIEPKTSAALRPNKTIRCLLDMRYPLPSRQSSAAIAFARQFTAELASAAPAQLSPPAVPSRNTAGTDATSSTSNVSTTADAQLHGVLLDGNRFRVLFDLFLGDCAPEVRRQADKSLARPIHIVVIHESGTGYRIRRSPMLDEPVARRYGSIREIDKGARPYFVDNSNPPAYVYEIRSDGRLEEFHAGSDAPCEERGE